MRVCGLNKFSPLGLNCPRCSLLNISGSSSLNLLSTGTTDVEFERSLVLREVSTLPPLPVGLSPDLRDDIMSVGRVRDM